MIEINEKFRPMVESPTGVRYYVITGGRGSSKSFSVATILSLLTYERGHTILFTRYTMKSAMISIIPEFLEKLELLGIVNDFEITKSEIVNKRTGNRILFRGIKTSSGVQTANLKSLQGISIWVVDEAEEMNNEDIFDTIDLSVREKGVHNRVIMILNPTTKEHFIYKRFFQDKGVNGGFNGVKGDTMYIHTDYRDNIDNLSKSFLDNIAVMKIRRPDKYQHKILGGWLSKAEGVIFNNWTIGDFNPNNIPTVFGQDYGFSNDPTTLIETAIDKNKKIIYLKEAFCKTKLKTSEIAALNMKYAGNKLIIGDSAEPRLISELVSKKCNLQAVKKGKDSIITGLTYLLDYELVIHEDSINLIKELNNYIWMDKKSNTPIDDWNHCIDAVRYAVYFQLLNPTYGSYSIF